MTHTKEFFDWIEAHINDNPSKLRLKYTGRKSDIDIQAAITQIECRRKFNEKLGETLSRFPDFIFPSLLAGEQSTSDRLATYHASLIDEGARVVDLTAGLGIDVFHFAEKASEVTAIEMDPDRFAALEFNAHGLGFNNIKAYNADCRDFVEECLEKNIQFDIAFIDPARRDTEGKRVFALADCQPDVVAMLPALSQICRRLIIKASPMLDIAHTVSALGTHTKWACALGTPTDCKELLIELDFAKDYKEPQIEALTLGVDNIWSFSFTRSEEAEAPLPQYKAMIKDGDYLYEGFPVLMKAGAFKLVAEKFGLSIFNPNTKLYYATENKENFPGRVYKVIAVLPYASKVIKRFKREYPEATVATRNFGMSADALRAKLGIKDGGHIRVYGLTDQREERILVVVETIKN